MKKPKESGQLRSQAGGQGDGDEAYRDVHRGEIVRSPRNLRPKLAKFCPDQTSKTCPKVLAIIPARQGSKGLPQKNILPLKGIPLIAYSIEAGRQAKQVTRVICSTDCEQIACIAKRYGAEVPFLRPSELAQDATVDLPVFQHAIQWLESHENWTPDIVVQLRPTSPIRLPGQIDHALDQFIHQAQADSLRAIIESPITPYKMWRLNEKSPFMQGLLAHTDCPEPYNMPRQQLPKVWWQTGTLDIVRAQTIRSGSMSGQRILPFKVEPYQAVDIDTHNDLLRAESVMAQHLHISPRGALFDRSKIKLLAMDVDGTLTPGTLFYTDQGEQLKVFQTRDGHGIGRVRELGIKTAIITAENSSIAAARAQKLLIDEVFINAKDKVSALQQIAEKHHIHPSEIVYIGDDLPDKAAMEYLKIHGGVTCAVSDALPEIRLLADYWCSHAGGMGAVREVCDRIIYS